MVCTLDQKIAGNPRYDTRLMRWEPKVLQDAKLLLQSAEVLAERGNNAEFIRRQEEYVELYQPLEKNVVCYTMLDSQPSAVVLPFRVVERDGENVLEAAFIFQHRLPLAKAVKEYLDQNKENWPDLADQIEESSGWVIENPAGMFDPKKDKDIKDTAKREAEEESGCKVEEDSILILDNGPCWDYPSISNENLRTVIAVVIGNGVRNLDGTELIADNKLWLPVREVEKRLDMQSDTGRPFYGVYPLTGHSKHAWLEYFRKRDRRKLDQWHLKNIGKIML